MLITTDLVIGIIGKLMLLYLVNQVSTSVRVESTILEFNEISNADPTMANPRN